MTTTSKTRRGFAAMTREANAEISRKGGKASHAKGTAHEYSPDEARAAGVKGGRSVSENREHMAEIGRRGGLKRAENVRTLSSRTTATFTT